MDEVGDGGHLGLAHALGGDRRRADAQARGDVRRAGVVGHRVLVEADAGLVEREAGLLARQVGVEGAQVDEHQVVVGAARHEAEPVAGQRLGQGGGVAHDLGGVLLELGRGRLGEGDGLGRDDVVERSALQAGEHRLVDDLGQLGGAQDRAAPRTPEGLVGGEAS